MLSQSTSVFLCPKENGLLKTSKRSENLLPIEWGIQYIFVSTKRMIN